MSGGRTHAYKHWRDKIGAVSRSWYGRLIAALILVGALICVMDVLAVAVRGVVNNRAQAWSWGQQEGSGDGQPAATPSGLQLASVQLLINVSGDDLTARYTVTSSSGQALAAQAEQAQRAGNSDALVSDLFGGISLAQFRDGFSANQYGWTSLGFMPPQLQVTGDKTTVTVDSNQLRLLLSQQYLEVHPPATKNTDPPGDVEFTYPSGLQVLNVNGASLTSTAGGTTDVQRGAAAVTATLREAGANWTTGLRSVGGIGLPVIGTPLQRLASLVVYLALLWGLSRIGRNLALLRRDVQSVVLAGMNAVRAIVGAFIALAALGFSYQLMFVFLPKGTGPLLAGPAGLALAGAVVLWPVACWRVVPAAGRRPYGRARMGRHWGRELLALSLLGVVYVGFTAAWSGTHPVTWWQVGPAVAGIVVLVYLLGRLLLGPSALGPSARLAILAALLVAVLAATVVWPVLVYTGFFQGDVLDVNVIGKWVYLAVALITIVGLCVMIARVVGVLSASHRRCLASRPDGSLPVAGIAEATQALCRRWRWTWRAVGSAVVALTLAATVPSLVNESQVGSARAEGLVPAGLLSYSGLYRALPQLLSWLLLALAIAVLLSAARAARAAAAWQVTPGRAKAQENAAVRIVAYRVAARQLALPVMMLILFSAYAYYYSPWAVTNYTWLYLPVTPLLGLGILAWVLPAKQATAQRTRSPSQAIALTLQAWRTAEFANSQRQQLLSNADDLRKGLLEAGPQDDGDRTFDTLADAQNKLSEVRDGEQRSGSCAPARGIRPPR